MNRVFYRKMDVMITRVSALLVVLCAFWPVWSQAQEFLPPDQAFQFQARSISDDQAELRWTIAEDYYLYHDQLQVRSDAGALKLQLPVPEDKNDPTFGQTKVHYHQVKTTIAVAPNQQFKIQWQGCAESGLCYPVQRATIQTDAQGLLPQSDAPSSERRLLSAAKPVALDAPAKIEAAPSKPEKTVLTTTPAVVEANVIEDEAIAAVENTEPTKLTDAVAASEISVVASNPVPASEIAGETQTAAAASLQSEWNNDQYFFNLLSEHHLFFNLLIFLGFGILLAFLPCSLPLIPILSGILVQRHRGYRAALIALAFVLGMAAVYAVMGLAVAQLGYSFQRWLQSPIFIGIFAVLFILFALNLFGVYQLSLPQGLLQRLDRWQQKQQGGTLVGAALMGMISALIVGPCMSAPLAGALLFVSQLDQPVLGATYLFVLGLGLGIPLFIAAVFGAKYLPKPGLWMDRLKFSFGFLMLALAVYFARPLLPTVAYFLLMGIIFLALAIYCFDLIRRHLQGKISRVGVIVLALAMTAISIWHIQHGLQQMGAVHAQQTLSWQKVHTQQKLAQLLQQNSGRSIVIDVYADWCVACQPVENEVLPRTDVQAALQDVVRIKLDLTEYHPSQDALLRDWQILGPPTMIFLDSQQQEKRTLRLTGTFSATQLIQRLQQLQQAKTS